MLQNFGWEMATLTREQVIDKALNAAEFIANKLGTPETELAKYMIAIAYVESTFNTHAKNKSSSARGLSQVLINSQRWIEGKLNIPQQPAMMKASKYPKAPVTAIAEEDMMFNPDYALLIGTWYLAYNYGRYNNWHKAVTAYHLGSYNSTSTDGKIYLAKVLKAFDELRLGEPLRKSINDRVPVSIVVVGNDTYLYKSNY